MNYCFEYSVITSLLNSVIRYLSSVLSKSSPPRYVSPFVALTCKTRTVLDANYISTDCALHTFDWICKYREMDKADVQYLELRSRYFVSSINFISFHHLLRNTCTSNTQYLTSNTPFCISRMEISNVPPPRS